jgi:iron complex outermembrane receptor protein
MNVKHFAVLMGSVAGYMLTCAPVAAQEAAPVESRTETGLGEIVVTAQKRAESLQSTPIAISALPAQAIEARGITDVSSLTAIAPSIAVTTSPASTAQATVFIRGIGDQEPLLTADSPVSIYVDGVVLGRSTGAVFDLVDLERIEVLRGPQGTLYGRNTIGGAVNFITAKPASEFGVKQKFSYGSFNQWQNRTVLDTGDIGETGLKARFSYAHRQQDGYVDNTLAPSNRDPGALNIDAFRAAVRFDNGGALRADYAFDFNDRKGIPAAFQATVITPRVLNFLNQSLALGGAGPVYSTDRLGALPLAVVGEVTDRVWGHTLTLEMDLAKDLTLRSITGYRLWKSNDTGDQLDGQGPLLGLAASPAILGGGPFTSLGVRPLSLFTATNVRSQDQWTQELNLIGSIGPRFKFVLGGFYFTEDSHEDNPQSLAIIMPSATPIPAGSTTVNSFFVPLSPRLAYGHKSDSYAGFAQGTYELTDALSITGGIRYTQDHKRLVQTSPMTRTLEADFNQWNWTVSADYKVNPDVMVYARVATGYKAGGFSARAVNAGYNPEHLTSYEVGLKSEFFDRHLRMNLTAFLQDRKDMQIQQAAIGSGGATSVVVNAGKARYQGIELESQAVLAKGLTASVSLGYVHRKYKQFEMRDPATNLPVDVAATARFIHSPDTTLNASLQYDFPKMSIGQLSAMVDYNYRGTVYMFPTTIGTPLRDAIAGAPRGLLGARMTLSEIPVAGTEATIAVWGRNLTDKAYRIHGIDFGSLGFAGNVYGEPRSVGVDVSFKL